MSTGRISDFVVTTSFNQIPQEAVVEAKKCFLDTLGNILSGCGHRVGKMITEYVEECGGKPEATVIGAGFKTSAAQAALANGTMAHVDEYGDHGMTWAAYPSGPLLPAVLALGERNKISGKHALEAYILGWEAGAAVGAATSAKMAARGIDATVGTGSFASVAAATKILNLDNQQTRTAIGIAAASAFGLAANWGRDAKPLYSGRGASNGVVAGLLAQKGFTANDTILEGPIGFSRVATGEDWDADKATKGLGTSWRMAIESGIKPYPCTGITHRSIDGVLSLLKEYKFSPEEVAEIECHLPLVGDFLHARPKTGLQAKYSLHYCVARALLDGEVGYKHFTDEAVAERKVQALILKVKLVAQPGIKYTMDEMHAVKVKLQDGREYYREIPLPRGYLSNPLSSEELTSKFRNCASSVLSPKAADRCLELIANLESLNDIGELMQIVARSNA
ncbi:MAG: MmgE/PrpD family protein [Betaproteobacteria bacterium]|nr:MmgE/PrpD family protein [Betaproteobacteria bacterium]